MQQHGFARNVEWSVASTSADLAPDEREPCLELMLQPNEYTKAMWPHDFKVVYAVTLHGTQLQTDYRRGSLVLESAAASALLQGYSIVLQRAGSSGLSCLWCPAPTDLARICTLLVSRQCHG